MLGNLSDHNFCGVGEERRIIDYYMYLICIPFLPHKIHHGVHTVCYHYNGTANMIL